jgi:predicted dehydrogenase
MIRVGIVGLGFMGKMHLGIYSSMDQVEIAAICDSNKESLNLSSLSGAGGNIATKDQDIDLSAAKAYTNYQEMLKDGGFDFVDICLPTYLHKEFSVAAMQAGYDVFCEKPMALTGAEADEMMAVAKKTGQLLTVGQCLRYWPMYVEIKRMIDTEMYGKVLSAELSRYSMTPGWSSDNWMLKGELSGNAAFDLHIHDVDMVLNLFGKPTGVTSSGVEAFTSGFGHIATLYTYPDKTVTSVGNWICTDSYGFAMRAFIVLENGVIELDTGKPDALVVYPADGVKQVVELDAQDGYFYELQDFVSHVESREPLTVVTPDSASESVKVVLAEIASAELKKSFLVD